MLAASISHLHLTRLKEKVQSSFGKQPPCSAEFISTAYQPWNNVFLSQQNSHSRLISRRNSLPNRVSNFPENGILEIYRI
jgi:hypothetical protein